MQKGLREEFDLKNLDPNIRANFWTILYQAYSVTAQPAAMLSATSKLILELEIYIDTLYKLT